MEEAVMSEGPARESWSFGASLRHSEGYDEFSRLTLTSDKTLPAMLRLMVGGGSGCSPFHRLNPLFHDLAEFRVDAGLIVAMAAWSDNPGTLTHEAAVFVRPFDEFDVPGAVFHDWAP